MQYGLAGFLSYLQSWLEIKEEIEVKGVAFEDLKEGTPEKRAASYLISILENLVISIRLKNTGLKVEDIEEILALKDVLK